MSQSISINQKMRDEIAHKLTVQALREAAFKFVADYRALNALFWTEHQKTADALLGAGKRKQAELIQAGMIHAESVVRPEIRDSDDDGKARWKFPIHCILSVEMSRVAQAVGLYDAHFGPLGTPWMASRREICLIFKSDRARPHINDMSKIEDGAIAQRLIDLASEWSRIIESGRGFYSEAANILNSCRTSRQLADIWPEAAKLIPKRADTSKSVVPKEAIDRVRTQLENGIPAGA